MDNLNTNTIFEEQRQQLLSIRKEIKLLSQQIDYLIRNEKPLGLLDIDVLMNRTHTLYDMLCAIETDQQDSFTEEDFDEDMVNVLASAVANTVESQDKPDLVPEVTETPVEETPVVDVVEPEVIEPEVVEPETKESEVVEPETTEPEIVEPETKEPEIVEPIVVEPEMVEPEAVEENIPQNDLFTVADNVQPEVAEMPNGDENFVMTFDEAPVNEEQAQDHAPIVDDYLYTMEQDEKEEQVEQEEEPVEKVVSDPIFEIIAPQGDDEFDEEDSENEPENEDLPIENSFDQPDEPLIVDETPSPVEEPENEEAEEVLADNQPSLFDVIEPEQTVLGEKMITEDNTLAAKLQNRPVGDLKSAIGINDKFLFVNELFGGSMEKYNRSIENLNDIQTYNGALIYLDELKVELQWNSNNVAYKKLADLVRLKFD